MELSNRLKEVTVQCPSCGSELQVTEMANTTYWFDVMVGKNGETEILFGKRLDIDPVGEERYFCSNPQCTRAFDRDYIQRLALQKASGEELSTDECPECGCARIKETATEKQEYTYFRKDGEVQEIDAGEYFGTVGSHQYKCMQCGHKWEVDLSLYSTAPTNEEDDNGN